MSIEVAELKREACVDLAVAVQLRTDSLVLKEPLSARVTRSAHAQMDSDRHVDMDLYACTAASCTMDGSAVVEQALRAGIRGRLSVRSGSRRRSSRSSQGALRSTRARARSATWTWDRHDPAQLLSSTATPF